MKFKNIFFSYLPLAIFFLLICCYLIVVCNFQTTLSNYVYIENLINYEGGLVRRGFLGNLILEIYQLFKIHPIIIIQYIYLFAYLIFVVQFFIVSKNLWHYNPYIFILISLGSPVILFPIFDFDALFRKEIFFFLVYFYHVIIAKKTILGKISLNDYKRKNYIFILPLILINIFIHEFQFFLIFFHTIINLAVLKKNYDFKFFIYYLIFPIIFLLFVFPADTESINQINNSLEKFIPGISNEYTPITILSGNINLQLGQTLWFFKNSSFNNFFQLLIVTIFTVPFFSYVFLKNFNNFAKKKIYKRIFNLLNIYLLIIFIVFVVLSFDSGRLLNILLVHLIGFYLIFPAEYFQIKIKKNNLKFTYIFLIFIYLFLFHLPHGPILAGKGSISDKYQDSIIQLLYKS